MLERVRSERNKQLILEELNLHLQNETLFLELASGAGQLVSFLAKNSPDITFQPSETNKSFMENILRLKHKFRLKNLLEPIYLDPCSDPDTWFVDEKPENCSIDYIFNSNTVHVNHYNCTKGKNRIFTFHSSLRNIKNIKIRSADSKNFQRALVFELCVCICLYHKLRRLYHTPSS